MMMVRSVHFRTKIADIYEFYDDSDGSYDDSNNPSSFNDEEDTSFYPCQASADAFSTSKFDLSLEPGNLRNLPHDLDLSLEEKLERLKIDHRRKSLERCWSHWIEVQLIGNYNRRRAVAHDRLRLLTQTWHALEHECEVSRDTLDTALFQYFMCLEQRAMTAWKRSFIFMKIKTERLVKYVELRRVHRCWIMWRHAFDIWWKKKCLRRWWWVTDQHKRLRRRKRESGINIFIRAHVRIVIRLHLRQWQRYQMHKCQNTTTIQRRIFTAWWKSHQELVRIPKKTDPTEDLRSCWTHWIDRVNAARQTQAMLYEIARQWDLERSWSQVFQQWERFSLDQRQARRKAKTKRHLSRVPKQQLPRQGGQMTRQNSRMKNYDQQISDQLAKELNVVLEVLETRRDLVGRTFEFWQRRVQDIQLTRRKIATRARESKVTRHRLLRESFDHWFVVHRKDQLMTRQPGSTTSSGSTMPDRLGIKTQDRRVQCRPGFTKGFNQTKLVRRQDLLTRLLSLAEKSQKIQALVHLQRQVETFHDHKPSLEESFWICPHWTMPETLSTSRVILI